MKHSLLRSLMLRHFSVMIKIKNEIQIILPMAHVAKESGNDYDFGLVVCNASCAGISFMST